MKNWFKNIIKKRKVNLYTSDIIHCTCDNGKIVCPGCDGAKESVFGKCAGCEGTGIHTCGKCGGLTNSA